VTPEINAIAPTVLVASLLLIGSARFLMRDRTPHTADGE
jgi:ABC-type spermidine/putrescine transport system permease subunit II